MKATIYKNPKKDKLDIPDPYLEVISDPHWLSTPIFSKAGRKVFKRVKSHSNKLKTKPIYDTWAPAWPETLNCVLAIHNPADFKRGHMHLVCREANSIMSHNYTIGVASFSLLDVYEMHEDGQSLEISQPLMWNGQRRGDIVCRVSLRKRSSDSFDVPRCALVYTCTGDCAELPKPNATKSGHKKFARFMKNMAKNGKKAAKTSNSFLAKRLVTAKSSLLSGMGKKSDTPTKKDKEGRKDEKYNISMHPKLLADGATALEFEREGEVVVRGHVTLYTTNRKRVRASLLVPLAHLHVRPVGVRRTCGWADEVGSTATH